MLYYLRGLTTEDELSAFRVISVFRFIELGIGLVPTLN